jgi:hypothetical protein
MTLSAAFFHWNTLQQLFTLSHDELRSLFTHDARFIFTNRFPPNDSCVIDGDRLILTSLIASDIDGQFSNGTLILTITARRHGMLTLDLCNGNDAFDTYEDQIYHWTYWGGLRNPTLEFHATNESSGEYGRLHPSQQLLFKL